MADVELTNMVMIQHPETGQVVVENRVKSWTGIALPGGHVEPGECFYDSAVREVREETGLEISDLQPCGLVHWCNDRTGERFLVFLYKTTTFCGQLIDVTEEGRVFWASLEEIRTMTLAPQFSVYLDVFLGQRPKEAFARWNDDEPGTLTLR